MISFVACHRLAILQYRYVAILKSLVPTTNKDNDELLDDSSADALLKARLNLNLKQEAVASHVGISQPYLHDLEQKRRRLRLRMFQRIKMALEKLG